MNTPHTPKTIRVTVPVSARVLERFRRLSLVSGQSVGRAMGGWLEETQEGLDPMIDILEQHKKAPLKAIRTLQNYASTLEDVTGDLFERVKNLDEKGSQLAALASDSSRIRGVLRKAQKAVSDPLTPPSSNTGGKVPTKPKKAKGG